MSRLWSLRTEAHVYLCEPAAALRFSRDEPNRMSRVKGYLVPICIGTTRIIQVERIRELAMEKSTGKISEDEFLAKKRQLLEMEHLRREADEETRRRAQVSFAYR